MKHDCFLFLILQIICVIIKRHLLEVVSSPSLSEPPENQHCYDCNQKANSEYQQHTKRNTHHQ